MVCYYHVKYTFQSESTLYSCLNVKELLPWNKDHISSLSDCNGIKTYNHLISKRTLNQLAKLDVVMLSSLATLNRFQTLVLCLYCWLSTVKYWLGNVCIYMSHTIQLRTFLKCSLFLSCKVIYRQSVYFAAMNSVQ